MIKNLDQMKIERINRLWSIIEKSLDAKNQALYLQLDCPVKRCRVLVQFPPDHYIEGLAQLVLEIDSE